MAYDTMLTIPAENSEVQVKDNDGNWVLVPHIGGVSTGGGDATVTKYTSFGTSGAEAGHPQPPDITCEITSYIPVLPVWGLIRNTQEGEREYRFFDGKPIIRIPPTSGLMVEIVAATGNFTDGEVTFTGTGADDVKTSFSTGSYGIGLVLADVANSKNYVVTRITSEGKVFAAESSTGKAAVVSATAMGIVKPAEMTQLTCNLVNITYSLVQSRIKEGTLSLSPTTLLPTPKILVDNTLYLLGK